MFQKHYVKRDTAGRVVSEHFFDEYIDIGVTYEYDSKGNLAVRNLQVPDGITKIVNKYYYDGKNRLISEEKGKQVNGTFFNTSDTRIFYDNNGKVVKKVKEFSLCDKSGEKHITLDKYIYNEEEILTKQETTVFLAGKKFTTASYYENGKIIRQYRDNDCIKQFCYDEEGMLIRTIGMSDDKEVVTEYFYEGNTTKTVVSYSDTCDVRKINYVNDASGRKVKQQYINPYNEVTVTYFIYDVFGNSVIYYVFNNKKQIEEICIENVSSMIFRHDADGRICKFEKREANSLPTEIYKYEYDARGNVIREEFDDGKKHIVTKEYDENNNLTKKIVMESDKITAIFENEYNLQKTLLKQTITDDDNKTITFVYNAASEIETIIEIENPENVEYSFDIEGEVYL